MLKKIKYLGAAVVFLLYIVLTCYTSAGVLSTGSRSVASDAGTSSGGAKQYESAQGIPASGSSVQENEGVDKTPKILKYTVKQGDTAQSIANQYKIKTATILASNGISATSILKIGQQLVFPSVDGLLYRVSNGETLWDIASTYDVDVNDIAGANKLDSPDELKIGQEIIIPGAEKVQIVKTGTSSSKTSNTARVIKVASRSGSTSSVNAVSGMWPVRGSITSVFGLRWGEFHKGIDIAAPTGTAVHAYMSGTVEFSGWNGGGYGNLVIIRHGNGTETYYGHNSELNVSAGQHIYAGQVISRVGSTGDSTGPHCHFEIRKNGIPVNPIYYLR